MSRKASLKALAAVRPSLAPPRPSSPPKGPRVRRDMAESAFEPLLADLVASMPGAHAAILVDGEGEAVDYSGRRIDAFDLRVVGAHFRLLLASTEMKGHRFLFVAGPSKAYVARFLPDGYAVVVVMRGRGARVYFPPTSRGFVTFERAIRLEAAWPPAPDLDAWHRVRVRTDRERKPRWIIPMKSDPRRVEILGTLVRLPPTERGYRVRLEGGGEEVTLIRELGGRWYADGDLDRAR
jgi:hypothetical protein